MSNEVKNNVVESVETKTVQGELTPEQQETLNGLNAECDRISKDMIKRGIMTVPTPMKNQTLYSKEDIINLSVGRPDYLSILAKKYKDKPSRVSTGIPELDYVSGGGWCANGLSILTAQPNIGKSTILIQSAVKMSQQGTAVVFITNDMRKIDLESKIISQLSYSISGEDCYRLSDITNRGVLSFDTDHNKQIAKILETTLQHLHIRDLIEDEDFDRSCEGDLTQDGLSRLEKIFDKYTAVYEKVIFIVDSLQQVAGYLDTGKSGVDSILRVFKKWSAKAPIVLVSTLNRSGYSKEQGEVNMCDLKESGALEYNTDLLLTMVPLGFVDKTVNEDLKAFKSKDYRDVMITCKKSRDSSERDQKMTLYAPGCTFIAYKEKENSNKSNNKDNAEKGVNLPPATSLNWVGIA